MSNDHFYPKLDDKTVFNVGLVIRMFGENPDYFDNPLCTYSTELKQWFKNRCAKDARDEDAAVPITDLESEAEHLFGELKTLGKDLDGADRLQWLKASTSLFEKLINLKERARGVKAIAEFKSGILEIIDSVMTPEQRTLVMDKINALV